MNLAVSGTSDRGKQARDRPDGRTDRHHCYVAVDPALQLAIGARGAADAPHGPVASPAGTVTGPRARPVRGRDFIPNERSACPGAAGARAARRGTCQEASRERSSCLPISAPLRLYAWALRNKSASSESPSRVAYWI